MAKTLSQSSSANIHIGPILNISASIMVGLDIANNAIVLIKENGTSAARGATTSALSVGPGIYRVVVNTADTDTLGALELVVSGSGAILHRETVEIWQAPTYALFFGSADGIATSAVVAGVSGAVAAVSAAVANVSANMLTSAGVSNQMDTVLTNYGVPTSGAMSAMVQAVVPTSAEISVIVAQGLSDYAAQTSAGLSAQLSTAFAGYAGVGVATSGGAGLTSSQVSIIVAQGLSDYGAQTSAGLSGQLSTAFQGFGLPTSAAMSAMVQAVVPTSGEISAIVAQGLADYDTATSTGVSTIVFGINFSGIMSAALEIRDVASSADVSVIVQAVVPTSAEISVIVAQGLSDYAALVSANLSAGIEAAIFQRTLDQPTSAPGWVDMPFDNAMEWMVARSLNRHAQTGTEIEIFTSGGAAFASASVDNNSVSAIRDQWI